MIKVAHTAVGHLHSVSVGWVTWMGVFDSTRTGHSSITVLPQQQKQRLSLYKEVTQIFVVQGKKLDAQKEMNYISSEFLLISTFPKEALCN